MILNVGFWTCKLVWMFLLSDNPSSSCCCWSPWKSGGGNYRVCIYPNYFRQTMLFVSIHLIVIRHFFIALLKQEKHWCLLLIKSYLLDLQVWERWYDLVNGSYEFWSDFAHLLFSWIYVKHILGSSVPYIRITLNS